MEAMKTLFVFFIFTKDKIKNIIGCITPFQYLIKINNKTKHYVSGT